MRFFTIAVLAALCNSVYATDGPNPNRYMIKGIVDELDEESVGSDATQAFGATVVMSLLDKSHSPSMLVMEFNNEANAESFKEKYDTADSTYTVEVDEPRYMAGNVRGSGIDNENSGRALAQDIPWGIENVFSDESGLDRGIPGEDNGPTLPTTITHPICIIDSGYQLDHPDLTNSASAADPSQTTAGEDDYFGNDGCQHGTHVAGTILASNNGEGVIGVFPGAPGTKIVKVFRDSNCGWFYSSGLIQALDYCRDSGAKIVTMSLGGGGSSFQESQAFTDATDDDDMLIIAAAGNGGNSGKSYPASYPAIMSVAAIDVNNNIAGFSQYNDEVDISGPGVGVKSTTGSSSYSVYSGTSMATPHVSAVALLLWNTFPSCTNHEIRNALETSALDLGDAGRDDYYGYGTVKFWAAHDYLTDESPCGSTNNPTFSPSPSSAPTAGPTNNPTISPSPSSAPTACRTSFRLELLTDIYGYETAWTVANAGGVVQSGSGYSSNTLHSIEVCIPDDACVFTITDSYSDGICCGYGRGNYTVFINDAEVGSGGEFGSSETVDLCSTTSLSPTTSAPTTLPPTTSTPTTSSPTSFVPTTPAPTTSAPTTVQTTLAPTTTSSTTPPPSTPAPSTSPPTTPAPSTSPPNTSAPSTTSSTTPPPTTSAPTTPPPTTFAPTTTSPTTSAPTTTFPTTSAPTTSSPTTLAPTTPSPTTSVPTTAVPTTSMPTTPPPSTSAPTTSAPTTTFPTTLAPTTSSNHMIVCGRTGRCGDEESRFASDTEKHEVRCCSTSEFTGSTKKSGCNVWGGSKLGEDSKCHSDQTFASATELCEAAGARLCTKDELEDDCTQGTGCNHDFDLIWSSTDDTPTTAPTASPSSSSNHMVVCGKTDGCGDEESRFASDNEKHEVRCCSTNAIAGWTRRGGCTVWGGSSVGDDFQCYEDQNFESAFGLCEAAGARLCTKGELEDDCTMNSGCGHDADLIWSSTDDTPTTAPTASPSSSSNHMIVCGRTGGCGNLEATSESDDGEHEVRCCSTSEFTGSSKRNGCDVWGGSNLGDDSSCYEDQNFASATDLCEAAGARLCTQGELEADCTKGTGCGHDADLIWTSTTLP